MSEAELQSRVLELAALYGWLACHFRAATTGRTYLNKKGELSELWLTAIQGRPGFVDMVLARDGRVLNCELKTTKGKLTFEQELWAQALGDSYRLWRPADLENGAIEKALQ